MSVLGLRPSSLVTKQGNSRQDKEWEDSETPDLETPVDKPEEPKTDNQMILRLLEEGEKVRGKETQDLEFLKLLENKTPPE